MKKKTFLKAVAMIMSLVTLASASILAGCGTEVIEKVDETKTTLKVFNYDAGFGSSWIENIKIEKLDKPVQVYNFTVEGNHNYLITESELLVHNKPIED